ncbi:MAG: cytochrome [SAR116 cluster bacterium]|nr:cytochrome [SAR116 cluster bacterium]RPG96376.1 MAG: cytochrome P450 [Candidatus Puniceispirillum sp. TMED176]|tara:strand:- start:2636 stop:3814 length:1179 start_codon:yes stop_codon:yes gene_type:complete
MPLPPVDDQISIGDLTNDPYSFYRRARAEHPVVTVKAVGRTMLTKATDTKFVKDNWELFSSDDPNTPMRRAFQAHTLMRKDGDAHQRERTAMASSFTPRTLREVWMPLYERVADDYIGRLPRGETVDLFAALAAPLSARCLSYVIGLEHVADADLCRWSQTLIDGAGNFGQQQALFDATDSANDEINAAIGKTVAAPEQAGRPHAIAAMLGQQVPLEIEAIQSNIKIVIGGGINEPRDAMLTAIFGLLSNPDQKQAVLDGTAPWLNVFEESIRWVAPIQVSSRRAVEDTQIRGHDIRAGDVVMTIQASANHDEDVIENGHLFDVHRARAPHQAFGNGPHFCLGTHVARKMVADIVLPRLFDRFPEMSLDPDQQVAFRGFGFRGPITMPVRLN